MIRYANRNDLSRIAEIYVYSNRLNYYPIFKDEEYSFKYLSVENIIKEYFSKEEIIKRTLVYDDGIIRGFMEIDGQEIVKFYVDSFFKGKGIGKRMMNYALSHFDIKYLWALEKNEDALGFYQKMGFKISDERKLEEGTSEYLLKLIYQETSKKEAVIIES